MKKILLHTVFYALLITVLSGCASSNYVYRIPSQQTMPGIYHRVEKGQTLWRIAKAYDTDLTSLVKINKIPNPSKIKVGQLIFIPKVTQTKKVNTSLPSLSGKKGFIWPVTGEIISVYGTKKGDLVNKGIDIKTKEGTTVVATKAGRVSFSDNKVRGFGKTIIIDHKDGYSTVYAHNSKNLVKAGSEVKQNQPIAKAGSTGRTSVCCLHFEIRKQHKPQNPFYYLP